MSLKYRIVAEGGENMCERCKRFDGKEFFMLESKPGENIPPFHPNCKCTYEIFDTDNPYLFPTTSDRRPVASYRQWERHIIEEAYLLVSDDDIRAETLDIRSEIERNKPGYVQTVVGGTSYGRPLTGAEIISRVKHTDRRLTNGKDYSDTANIGIDLSRYYVDIGLEYENYKLSSGADLGYEAFANICAPYWEADFYADAMSAFENSAENAATMLTALAAVYFGAKSASGFFGNLQMSMPQISSKVINIPFGFSNALNSGGVGVASRNTAIAVPALERGISISGIADAGHLGRMFVAGGGGNILNNVLFQINDGNGGRTIGGRDGGVGNEGAGKGITSNQGKIYNNTPSTNHTTTTKNPGHKGTPNSSVDILDDLGNIQTRRWFGADGKAVRDIDMTNHGNPKTHPEWPHEHIWQYGTDGKPIGR